MPKFLENSCGCEPDFENWEDNIVCGADGVNYVSECYATCAEVEVASEGRCADVTCSCDASDETADDETADDETADAEASDDETKPEEPKEICAQDGNYYSPCELECYLYLPAAPETCETANDTTDDTTDDTTTDETADDNTDTTTEDTTDETTTSD